MSKPIAEAPQAPLAARPWLTAVGGEREYDLFKELTVGVVVVGVRGRDSPPSPVRPMSPPSTFSRGPIREPADFVATATAELGRTSDTATYGPPYSTTKGATQTLGALDLQSFSGTRIPIDTAADFVTTRFTSCTAERQRSPPGHRSCEAAGGPGRATTRPRSRRHPAATRRASKPAHTARCPR